jgi:probable F420-dependent oxidoreductase
MTIAFSCRCPNTDYLGFEASPEAITSTAIKAEALGYDAIFVNDHIIVDDGPRSEPWTNAYDPLVALSFIAAHTRTIRFGVSVLIVPYRNPIATAKALATIDRMSGGRLIAGVGVGWNEPEYAALGIPFRERGARTTEYIKIWQACWAPGKVSYQGRFFSFTDMHVNPKPVQTAIPFWVGGTTDAGLRRAAAIATVWQPTPLSQDDLVSRQAFLRDACTKAGRADVPATRMSYRVEFSTITGNPKARTPAQVAEELQRYRDGAKVDAFQINFHGNRDLAQLLDSMECFMREVKPRLS